MFDVRTNDGNVTPTIFSVRDGNYHRLMRHRIANAYTTSSMREFEDKVDICTSIFEAKLRRYQGKTIDLGTWLHWFAFDVISSITFSNRLGFMEKEEDISGIIGAIEGRLVYNAVVGQVPYLNGLLLGNTTFAAVANRFQAFSRLNSVKHIVEFVKKQLARYDLKSKDEAQHNDMLARFKRRRDGEEVISAAEILSHTSANIFAGSDTTATALRATIYFLCRNPTAYAKAVAEIDAANSRSEQITYAESQKLTYVQCCIKEGLRIHPAVCMLLERVVPEGGCILNGVHFPAGTIVGINPWVASRDKSVYGEDAAEFRPERWLEASHTQLRLMERNFLSVSSLLYSEASNAGLLPKYFLSY
jgi:cytochrome P450